MSDKRFTLGIIFISLIFMSACYNISGFSVKKELVEQIIPTQIDNCKELEKSNSNICSVICRSQGFVYKDVNCSSDNKVYCLCESTRNIVEYNKNNLFIGKWEKEFYEEVWDVAKGGKIMVVIESNKIYLDKLDHTEVYLYKLLEDNKVELIDQDSDEKRIVPLQLLNEGNALRFDNMFLTRTKD